MRHGQWILWTALALPATAGAAEAALVEGAWQKHEETFAYAGTTARLSCIGLERKMKRLLTLVGARPGFTVEGGCADAPGVPPAIAVVRLKFYALVPGGAAAGTEAGQGAWRAIAWGPLDTRDFDAADCELIDQFRREILPMFTVRDLKSHMNCLPNQADLSGIRISFSVLGAVPPAKVAGTG